MEPGVRYEYLRREVTYFGGDQVSYAHDGRTGTKRYIKFTATGQFLEDLGVFWNKPSQYELLELQQRLGNGIEIHYAHDRYANQQTYIKIDTRRQTVVSDLGKSWRRG